MKSTRKVLHGGETPSPEDIRAGKYGLQEIEAQHDVDTASRSFALPMEVVNSVRPSLAERRGKLVSTPGKPKDECIQKIWVVIMADPERVKHGWGLTNHRIKREGMDSDEIAQVLKKKTHHVIPVITSDQIAKLLPLVNHTTKQFGFVINSQSETKPGMHWRAIYFDRKKAEVCYIESLVTDPTEAVLTP